MASSLFVFRLVAFLALLSIACLFGLLPLLLQRLRGSAGNGGSRLLALANAFAGGLFLGGGFVSMLGEAIETSERASSARRPALFPLALCPLGFGAAFFTEKVVFHQHHRQDDQHSPRVPRMPSLYGSCDPDHHAEQDPLQAGGLPLRADGRHAPLTEMLIAVLSLHSLITGISLGLQESLSSAIPIFMSLALHKSVEALALGVNLVRTGKTGVAFLTPLILFAAMEPAGVLLGWSLSAVLDGRMAAATGILTALASGTFIYVATVDVLLPEFEVSARDKYLKSLLATLGYCVLLLLVFGTTH